MSSSLIPERPLLISPTLAATIGLEEAVLLHVLSELQLQHPAITRNGLRFTALSDDTLLAALPFWKLSDIQRVQQSLQGLGLLVVETINGTAQWAINQPSKAASTTPARPRQPAATASSRGTLTTLPANWQPDATLFLQCAQRNIPREFVERELGAFRLDQRDRNKKEYSWHHSFLKWVVAAWEKQRSALSARVLESSMPPDWQPSEEAVSILEHGGITLGYIEETVPEFVLYWKEKGTVSSEWNSRFIAHVRRQWERYTHALEHDSTPRPIPRNFQPDSACFDVLAMANIDADFAEAQIKEFVLYWQDRNEIHRSWNTKFLQHGKYKWAQRSQVGKSLLDKITDRSWAD